MGGEIRGKQIEKSDLIIKQRRDPLVGAVYDAVALGKRQEDEWTNLDRKSKVALQRFSILCITGEGILKKTTKYKQIVLPEAYYNLFLSE